MLSGTWSKTYRYHIGVAFERLTQGDSLEKLGISQTTTHRALKTIIKLSVGMQGLPG